MSKGKKIKTKWKIGVCEIEKYTSGSIKSKKVFFCQDCKSWMCVPCSKKFALRIMAMINKDLSKKVKL